MENNVVPAYGTLLYLDANCFIYLFEEHPVFGERAQRLFAAVERGEYQALTSTLTLMEVMAGPIKVGEKALANQYEELIMTFPHLMVRDMNRAVASRAAFFRATGVKAPDAIHLATAVIYGAQCFVTEDQQIGKAANLPVFTLAAMG